MDLCAGEGDNSPAVKAISQAGRQKTWHFVDDIASDEAVRDNPFDIGGGEMDVNVKRPCHLRKTKENEQNVNVFMTAPSGSFAAKPTNPRTI